jgi:hypothetical protein
MFKTIVNGLYHLFHGAALILYFRLASARQLLLFISYVFWFQPKGNCFFYPPQEVGRQIYCVVMYFL